MNHLQIKFPLPLQIVGIGRYLPNRRVFNPELERKCGLSEGWCERKQGIRERRWVEDETISSMAAIAVLNAVGDAGIAITDIDLLINASNNFEQVIPDQSVLIRKELGLEEAGPACFSVNCGCLSFLMGMDIAANMLALGRYKNIAIVSAAIWSIGYISPDNPVVYTMLGDGAAAVILRQTPEGESSGVYASLMETYCKSSEVSCLLGQKNRKIMFGHDVLPDDFWFQFDAQGMQSAGLKYNQKFLKKLWPTQREKLKLVIPNQSTRLAIDMMKFTFPADRVKEIISRFGNMGPVGYPMALYEAVKEKQIQRGDMILMIGVGAGISMFGMVFTY